jgi:hypothetical protein
MAAMSSLAGGNERLLAVVPHRTLYTSRLSERLDGGSRASAAELIIRKPLSAVDNHSVRVAMVCNLLLGAG